MAQGDERTAEDVAEVVGLAEPKVQYFLDVLKERQFLEEMMYSGRASDFVLTPEGRKYLFEHKMLE